MKSLMRSVIMGLIAATLFSAAAIADHERGKGRKQVAEAAHELEKTAKQFYKLTYRLTEYSRPSSDAHQFAKAARHFHKTVERGAYYGNLISDFNHLENRYHYLKKSFYRAHRVHHNWRVLRDWYDVEWA